MGEVLRVKQRAGSGLGSLFTRLWQASTASNLADGIVLTAGPLLAAALTRDPVLVAGLATAQRLPWFLFSLVSGALVDRLDRRQVLWMGNAIRATLLAGIGLAVFLGLINIPMLYLLFFSLGIVETFFDNAAFAILPRMVREEQLEKANGRLFAAQTVANEFVGPPMGSFLFALVPSSAFLLSALFFGSSSALVSTLPGSFSAAKSARMHLAKEILDGFNWFWRNKVIRTLAFLAATYNLVTAASFSILVLFAQDQLGMSEAGYGLLLSVGALGGILGGLIAEGITKRLGTGTTIVIDSLLGGVALAVIGLTSNISIVIAMLATMSFGAVLGNTVILSLRQSVIPDTLLGRVTSVYRFFCIGAAPIGALLGGLLARGFGLTTPFWLGGLVLILATILSWPMINNTAVYAAKAQTKRAGSS